MLVSKRTAEPIRKTWKNVSSAYSCHPWKYVFASSNPHHLLAKPFSKIDCQQQQPTVLSNFLNYCLSYQFHCSTFLVILIGHVWRWLLFRVCIYSILIILITIVSSFLIRSSDSGKSSSPDIYTTDSSTCSTWKVQYQPYTDSGPRGIWDGYETKEEFASMHLR